MDMKKLDENSRYWFWAKKACLHYGGFREKNVIKGANLRMSMFDPDKVIRVESDNGACSVRVLGFNINRCSICG